MLKKDIVDFFKRHNLYDEEMFGYISSISQEVDYYDQTSCCIGCAPILEPKEERIIKGISLTLPYCTDEITYCIAVNKIAHAIYLYKKMGQKFNMLEYETFPLLVEKLYCEERKNDQLTEYKKLVDSFIDEEGYFTFDQWRFAYGCLDSFQGIDISDFEKIDSMNHELALKWEKDNTQKQN